jgi:hypothetical protein
MPQATLKSRTVVKIINMIFQRSSSAFQVNFMLIWYQAAVKVKKTAV